MIYVERHFGDLIKDTVHLSMLEFGAYNLLMDMYYVKEMPLQNRKICYKFARAQTKTERDAVDFVLAEFFNETDFGFTQSRCDKEIEKYQLKQSNPNRKESQNARQARARERRKVLFEQLNMYGVTMAWNTQMALLEAELSRLQSNDVTLPVTGTVTLPVTRDVTDNQSPITIYKKEKEKSNPQSVDNSSSNQQILQAAKRLNLPTQGKTKAEILKAIWKAQRVP